MKDWCALNGYVKHMFDTPATFMMTMAPYNQVFVVGVIIWTLEPTFSDSRSGWSSVRWLHFVNAWFHSNVRGVTRACPCCQGCKDGVLRVCSCCVALCLTSVGTAHFPECSVGPVILLDDSRTALAFRYRQSGRRIMPSGSQRLGDKFGRGLLRTGCEELYTPRSDGCDFWAPQSSCASTHSLAELW
jgi:hypothetical protein